MKPLDIIVTEERSGLRVQTIEPLGIQFWVNFYREFIGTEIRRIPEMRPTELTVATPDSVNTTDARDFRYFRSLESSAELETTGNEHVATVTQAAGEHPSLYGTITRQSDTSYLIESPNPLLDTMQALRTVFEQASDPENSYGGRELASFIEGLPRSVGVMTDSQKQALREFARRLYGFAMLDSPLEKVRELMTGAAPYKWIKDSRRGTLFNILRRASGGEYKPGNIGYTRKKQEAPAASPVGCDLGC